jgi:glutamine---fructose-6-phosphate transaminase (isomerizing)
LGLSVVRGEYLKDLLEQPNAIRATWQALHGDDSLDSVRRLLAQRKFDRLVLTGMGSSFFALHPMAMETAEHGWTPVLLETSELVHYYPHLISESSLVIAVSQSGRSAETVRLLERNARKAAVIAVTNTADSPLATQAEITLLTQAGDEFSVSCKTYVATLVAVSTLSAALCGLDASSRLAELEVAADAAAAYLRNWSQHVEEFGAALREIRNLFLVGRGSSLAAVGAGALITKESDHFHAEGMSSAAFRHGPMEMLTTKDFVGVFSGDELTSELNERLLSEIQEHGTTGMLIGSRSSLGAGRLPSAPAVVRPILEILPVEMITLALAALANREAGKFERATKVTVVE